MASRPPRYCPACRNVHKGRCAGRAPPMHGRDTRRSSDARGYNARWRKAALRFLFSHPLCVQCRTQGHITRATQVDHIQPHKGNDALFWNVANWQPLCKRCHSRKTATEDGGFGNVSRPAASAPTPAPTPREYTLV